MKGRFDYIEFDQHSKRLHQVIRKLCLEVESFIEKELLDPGQYQGLSNHDANATMREAFIAMTQLENMYGRLGRAIKMHQLALRGPCDPQ